MAPSFGDHEMSTARQAQTCRRAPISVTLALLGWAENRVVLIRLQEGKQDLSVRSVLNLALHSHKIASCKLNAKHYGVGTVSKCVDNASSVGQELYSVSSIFAQSSCGVARNAGKVHARTSALARIWLLGM
jgi:hypothetical protein